MAKSFLHPLAVCLVLLSGSCLASRQSSPQSGRGECDIQTLNPIEAGNRIQHEAGYTETWDENNQQLRCAGVAVTRHVIQSKGLLVPSFNNAPSMAFVLEGEAVGGVVFPGCPETFQSFQQTEQGSQSQEAQDPSFRDQHQKILDLRKGDAFVVPAGIVHWVYNEASEELVLLVVHDISNPENQLDQNLRRFFLGGNQQGQQGPSQLGQKSFGFNVFQQVDTKFFAQASGVPEEVIRKLRNEGSSKGFIVRVREGLRLVRPDSKQQQGQGTLPDRNGYEETICTQRLKENLIIPERADIYTARGGSISTLNRFTLPILRGLQFSAGRGHLRPNAMVSPYWNVNGHSVTYVKDGSGRMQIVGHSSKAAYDGEIRKGHLLIIPQNFVSIKKAGPQGLEWFTFKTNDNAKASPIVGRTGVFRGVPVDVWFNAHEHLTRDEARALKYNREEITILDPEFSSKQQQEGSPRSII